jgi:D-alanyl-D-alanine dipeptidase
MESITVPHIGANLGDTTARVLAVFMEGGDPVKTLALPAPDTPPASPDASRVPDLVDLAEFDPRLKFDIRYATTNNFMSVALYPVARALLQRPAVEALGRAHERLRAQGYGLVVLDAYRPWWVTRMMWDRFPKHRAYLADPLKGSRHNRGAAVDVTLFDLVTGAQVAMPSDYDDFSERAHPDHAGGTPAQRAARDRLRETMEAEGFSVYPNEWWHFDYRDWRDYPVLNQSLEKQD